jgi:DNA-binding FrmR family transcriptional regulator
MKADQQKITRLLKTVKGQVEGILKMVEEDRYCIDISNQILATQSILRKINKEIIHAHMHHCVKEAFTAGDVNEKIEEILGIMDKMSR